MLNQGRPSRGCEIAFEIEALRNIEDIGSLLTRMCQEAGLSNYLLIRLPINTGDTLSSRSIMNDWPREVVKLVDSVARVHEWQCLQPLKYSTKPYTCYFGNWTGLQANDENERLDHLTRHFGMSYAHVFPVHDAFGNVGAVMLSGTDGKMAAEDKNCFLLTSISIFSRIAELRGEVDHLMAAMTERELECLAWTAEGKTTGEIAQILDLSPHTINHFLLGALRKLGASNRTHAVVRAVRLGLISI